MKRLSRNFIGLGLLSIVLIAIVFAATTALLNRDGIRQEVNEASGVAVGTVDEPSEEGNQRAAEEPPRAESDSATPDPVESGDQETQGPFQEGPPELGQPTATPTDEPTRQPTAAPAVEPTAEPTPRPTAEPTAAEPVTPEAAPEPVSGP